MRPTVQLSIVLPKDWGSGAELTEEMRSALTAFPGGGGAKVQLQERRSIETAVLVAAITGGATVIAALIQAIATIATKRHAKTMKIVGRLGGQVEVPIDATAEDVKHI